jgi:hypothetical protein
MSKSELDSEFFVGYLPTPAGSKRFLRWGVLAIGLVAGGLVLALAAGERDPGAGVWNLEEAKVLDGVVHADPSALIRVTAEDGRAVTVLLIDQGKIGARERVRDFDGRSVRVSGHMLSGRNVLMLELNEGAESIKLTPGKTSGSAASATWQGDVVLRGEVVDSKCFAGAMKPGEGKTHKACAALCLRGGIPAMFMAVEDGKTVPYLLVDSQGKSPSGEALERILPFVGDWVEIHARAGRWADLRILEISADGIRRR